MKTVVPQVFLQALLGEMPSMMSRSPFRFKGACKSKELWARTWLWLSCFPLFESKFQTELHKFWAGSQWKSSGPLLSWTVGRINVLVFIKFLKTLFCLLSNCSVSIHWRRACDCMCNSCQWADSGHGLDYSNTMEIPIAGRGSEGHK